jgi:hypothetical protein
MFHVKHPAPGLPAGGAPNPPSYLFNHPPYSPVRPARNITNPDHYAESVATHVENVETRRRQLQAENFWFRWPLSQATFLAPVGLEPYDTHGHYPQPRPKTRTRHYVKSEPEFPLP